jgi:Big-like domain-containing protein
LSFNDFSARMHSSFLRPFRPLWLAPFALLLVILAAGCYFDNEEKVQNTLSFDRVADSLKQFDEVTIIVKNLEGATLDVIYRGKVEQVQDLQKLKAPHWNGGAIVVSITGYKDGILVYQTDTRLSSGSDARDLSVVITPFASLTSDKASLGLLVGDSLPLPVIKILPENLVDKSLEWSVTPDGFLDLGPNHIKGRQAGSGQLIVRLKTNHAITYAFAVTVSTTDMVPNAIAVLPESLEVAADGAPKSFSATAVPSGAAAAVSWSSADQTIATVDANGLVQGKRRGLTRITATSLLKSSVTASAPVNVTGPIAVERIAFGSDSLEILVGAAPESLMVSALPLGASPAATFTLSDPTKASILNGRITGKAAGLITVTAVSASNPAAVDELIVRITVPSVNDTTPPGKPTVVVTPAGPTRESRPVWSWKTGGGGAGAYQVSLDKATFDATAIAMSDTSYTPAAGLAAGLHVLYVRERDAAGNWSAAGSAQVDIDTTGPAAPKVLGPAQTSSLPRWTWSSGGNGGAGFFRFRQGDADFPAGAPESRDTVFSLAAAVNGTTYTLYVQERDLAGNWSPAASLPIKYDLTKPNVAFSKPQSSGIFVTAMDTVTIAGMITGPNGIAKAEYVLDAGTPAPITVAANGSWTVAALKFANAKTTTLKVTATDNLGNTGEAELQILRDSDIPLPPTALVKPASPTNVVQSAWTWSTGSDAATGSGLSGKYRWKLNAGTWTETIAASASGVLLAEGTNTFSVQEQDKAGNWSDALTGTVLLDTKAPDAVTFVGVDGGYTADATPTWTWKPSTTNGGIGKYLVKLNAGSEFEVDSATYTPGTPFSDTATVTLTVREKDQVNGVAGPAKSFVYKIKVNPPGTPIVKSAVVGPPPLANNGLTNNPGFTWTSGGGGNAKYRVKVNAETAYRVNGVAQTTFSLAATDADGTYKISVSEQDDLGRYGPEGSFTINLDRTAPVFTNATILNKTYVLRDNFITNVSSLAITYKSDGVSKSFPCTLTDNAATVCKDAAQTDAAGNTATFQRTIWRRSNVVFFTPTGTGDGSSWEEAASDIQAQVDAGSDGKDFWLASGDFTAKNDQLSIWGMTLNLTGGFFADTYPTNTSGRNKGGTILAAISTMGTYGTWDGIKFVANSSGLGLGLSLGSDASPAKIIDCQFKATVDVVLGGNLIFQNCQMIGVKSSQPLNINGNYTVVWDGGAIQNNQSTSNNYGIAVGSGTVSFKGALTISGNASMFSTTQMYNNTALDIASSVTFSCSDLQNGPEASGRCKGAVIVPGP